MQNLERDPHFLRSLLALSDDCIKLLDLDGNLVFMSEGGLRVMEVGDFAAIEGRHWPAFWCGQGNAEALAAVAAAKAGGTAQFQGLASTLAGTPKWWDVKVKPVLDAAGRPERLLVVSRDITEQRLSAEALSASEKRYRTLFNSIDEGFCIIEFLDGPFGPLSDYIHVEANPAYAHHAGITDVVGQKVRDMVPAEAAGWVELYGGVLRSGRPIRFERELVATGRHLELAAFRVDPPELRQVAVLFQDVTARRKAEAALQRLNETLEQRIGEAIAERKVLADIVEGTGAFVQVLDLNYRWLAINRAARQEFERLVGLRPRVGDRLPELLKDHASERSRMLALWDRALAGEDFVEVAAFADGTGVTRHYEMHFSPLRDISGVLTAAFHFVYDVTERIEAQVRLSETEAALRQAQKMEAVGQLTGGIAHDFNNLLTGVTGALELLQSRLHQGRLAEVEKYISAAQNASRRAASLTHRLLAFSRRQTLDPKPTDVNRLVMGMEEMIRRTVGPQVALEVVTAGGLWPTFVDPPQLENALLNLCINARDAMPDGGRITIETANRWLDERAAAERDVPPGQYLSICVTDTGVGMPPEVAARAFDPFFTTKPTGQGTGLGLSMVYGFVRQSGGQVRIYSEVGQGTNMCLYLPRYYGAADAQAAVDAAASLPHARANETVLVVDDEPMIRMLAADVLQELGYGVIEAEDGPSGLKILQSDTRIDLLVSDVGLPGGMNGRQLADAARITRPDLKVLFITGYAENAIIGNGQVAPGMQVVTKPFTMEDFAGRIRQILEPGR
ncbi:PAS domain-containing protein [Ancylobacter lacus]|uniref:PAS domain-containing protein n=1 Tax=Ancylobacter lacus TaxID=2579970 RepID=UPI0031B877FA